MNKIAPPVTPIAPKKEASLPAKTRGLLILGTQRIAQTLCLLIFLAVIASCDKGAYIKVDGKVFSEDTLKKESPELYQTIRKNYDERILDALKDLSETHLLTLLAKEKNLDGGETSYIEWLRTEIAEPTDAESKEYYDNYRAQNPGQKLPPFPTVIGEIRNVLQNERLQQRLKEDLRVARQTYGYEIGGLSAEKPVEIDITGAPTRGNPQAKIEIIEFSGFECPYCQRVQATTKRLREELYPDQIHWVFKDYPLRTSVLDAHLASRCLFMQNANVFWNFFDGLYTNDGKAHLQAAALRKNVAGYSEIDQQQFDACLIDAPTADYVLKSHSTGIDLGVQGIPAFFINGKLLSGAQPIEAFQQMIEEALN